MTKEKLLEQYAKGLASTGKTRNLYLKFAGDFLDYAEGDFSRDKVSKYMEHLHREHHYGDGSTNFAFRVVRTLFSRNSLEWPFRRGESPSIREDNIEAPALHPDIIAELITAVKKFGSPVEQSFLALSTTYGLRREEMVNLQAEDIRLKDKTIHIETVKNGRERTHVIPDVIVPYLSYDFNQERSDYFLFALWYQIEHLINLPHTHKVGWHSVRRTVNTMLGKRIPDKNIVMSFMRWKQRTSSDMTYRYSAIKFVGREGTSTEVVGDALSVDNEVFKVHPFINLWR